MRQAWQYAKVPDALCSTSEDMNQLGGQGWELVAITDPQNPMQVKEYIFKRPMEWVDAGVPVLVIFKNRPK